MYGEEVMWRMERFFNLPCDCADLAEFHAGHERVHCRWHSAGYRGWLEGVGGDGRQSCVAVRVRVCAGHAARIGIVGSFSAFCHRI